jgi:hypothetical protein
MGWSSRPNAAAVFTSPDLIAGHAARYQPAAGHPRQPVDVAAAVCQLPGPPRLWWAGRRVRRREDQTEWQIEWQTPT